MGSLPKRKAPTRGQPQGGAAIHLDKFQKRCAAVRDLVHHALGNEDTYGLYLWGPGGCGKTTGIERALAELGVTPILFRGTATAQSLFNEARNSPDGVLWLSDVPTLWEEPAAQQYALAMLEDRTDRKTGQSCRMVNRSPVKVEDRFVFNGKLIFDSNLPVVPKMFEAVEERLIVHHFGPTDAELTSVIRYLASLTDNDPGDDYSYIRLKERDRKYWKNTTQEERGDIAEFIIEQAKKHETPLNLRSLRDACKYYIDQRDKGFQTDWRDVVTSELTRRDVEYRYSKPPSRKDERLDSERQELIVILEDAECCLDAGTDYYKHNVIEVWCEATGRNERQFHRRLAEIPEAVQRIYERLADRRARKKE